MPLPNVITYQAFREIANFIRDNGDDWLGCAFRFLFRFLPGLIFRNSGYSAEFPGFRRNTRRNEIIPGQDLFGPEFRTQEFRPEFRRHSMPRVTNIQLAD